jgi:flagellar motor switch protein FliN
MTRELIPHPQALCDALAEELAGVLGATSRRRAGAVSEEEDGPTGWIVPVRVDGTMVGALTVGFGRDEARALAASTGAVIGHDTPEGDHAVMTGLHGLVADAVRALAQRPICDGLDLGVGSPRRPDPAGAPPGACGYRLDVNGRTLATIRCWAAFESNAREDETVRAAPAIPSMPPPALAATATVPPPTRAPNLEVVLDIDLPLTVRFGETDMTLDALTRIGTGTVVDLGRSPDDPVDVLVNGRLVARGTVVVVAGNYGVRVTEVVSASDRARTLGA